LSEPVQSAGAEAQRYKKCSRCKQWLPATTEYFYPTTSRGKRTNSFGEPYLRSQCRQCKRDLHNEWARTNRPKRTPEEVKRYAKMQRARRRAYQRLADMNEEGFKLLYAEELLKEGIRLERYVGPTIRMDDARSKKEEG